MGAGLHEELGHANDALLQSPFAQDGTVAYTPAWQSYFAPPGGEAWGQRTSWLCHEARCPQLLGRLLLS